jgi:hypothetical protein
VTGKMVGVREAFIGTEEEHRDLIKNSRWVSNPELEFFKNKGTEELLAVVRGNEEVGGKRVYKIHDYKLINVLRLYSEATRSWVTFYKRKR